MSTILLNATPVTLDDYHESTKRTGQHSPIRPKHFRRIMALLVDSRIPARIASWRAIDKRGPGGRPQLLSDELVLTLLLVLTTEHSPALLTDMTNLLMNRLPREILEDFGLLGRTGSSRAFYNQIRRTMRGIIGLTDPYTTPMNRRLLKTERDQYEANRNPDQVKKRQARLEWLSAELLYITYKDAYLSGAVKNWAGNTTIDGTAWPTRGKAGEGKRTPWAGSDQAWWYGRDFKNNPTDNRKVSAKYYWALESTIVAMSSNTGTSADDHFPYLALAMSVGKPANDPSGFAIRAYQQVLDRFAPEVAGGYVIGDRGFAANAAPENFQLPLKAMGFEPVFDYKIDQLGIVDARDGAIMVEGQYYCPAMPAGQIDASSSRRLGEIDDHVYALRIDGRRQYALRPKQKADGTGGRRYMCPAAGPSPTVKCIWKPTSFAKPSSNLEIHRDDLPTYKPLVCSQDTITIPVDLKNAKFRQKLPYQGPEWLAQYSPARNVIEGTNAHVKDTAKEALANPDNRRMRGYAAQYLLVTAMLFASNMRKIDHFLEHHGKPGFRKTGPRRRDSLESKYTPRRNQAD